jgi:Leucine-rich repeat (LRR) protein
MRPSPPSSFNQFSAVPEDFSGLTKLEGLALAHNAKLERIPPLADLKRLQRLDLAHCALSDTEVSPFTFSRFLYS